MANFLFISLGTSDPFYCNSWALTTLIRDFPYFNFKGQLFSWCKSMYFLWPWSYQKGGALTFTVEKWSWFPTARYSLAALRTCSLCRVLGESVEINTENILGITQPCTTETGIHAFEQNYIKTPPKSGPQDHPTRKIRRQGLLPCASPV